MDEGRPYVTELVELSGDGSQVKLAEQTYDLFRSPDFQDLTVIDNSVYVNDSWRFLSVSGDKLTPLLQKTANYSGIPEDCIHLRKIGHSIVAKGAVHTSSLFEKWASGVDYIYAKEDLKRYATAEDFDKVVAELEEQHEAYITQVTPESLEAPQIDKVANQCLLKAATYLTPNVIETMIKEGAATQTQVEETVDAALGLGFLTDENLQRFLDNMHALDSARALLSQLLIAGRLGLEVDVNVIRHALFGVDKVIGELKTLRQSQTLS